MLVSKLPAPAPELEEEGWEEDEPDLIEDEPTEGEITFTERDKTDFLLLEQEWENGGIQQAEAIRKIRKRRLWRLCRDDEGKQLYATFDQYCEERWGHTRQWATQQTNWLAITEENEAAGHYRRTFP